MIVDFDDFSETNHRLDLLQELKRINPAFKCTLFAVPGQGSPGFWSEVPVWCELAVHGWMHPDPYECADWTYEQMAEAIYGRPEFFVKGFKAPGWQISDGCYEALLDHGWWVADQPYNDHRRPVGLRVHLLSDTASSGTDPAHWHGHIQDVCGNGLKETWGRLTEAVANATSFEFVSEAATPWT